MICGTLSLLMVNERSREHTQNTNIDPEKRTSKIFCCNVTNPLMFTYMLMHSKTTIKSIHNMDHIREKQLRTDPFFGGIFSRFREYGAKPNIFDMMCRGHTTE
jgi:hypothetical protein